ncbi:hypothetical protein T265_11678 [Opisthorchis viverrini]|uniref:Uncharacterized protein n=1 Tax=Opisthorchis viverrini TaxID=6198 RepID=A0A074ZWP3_OPIVI|nr:hypothetical protein T265_11678 [Opisthorchis viverrini]KER19594.1 hypothetical protein T265_11678 [Opisthorchis viverrini]
MKDSPAFNAKNKSVAPDRRSAVATLSVLSCHATRRKHEGGDTARLPKPRQGKSRGRGRARTTDLPVIGLASIARHLSTRFSKQTSNTEPLEAVSSTTNAGSGNTELPEAYVKNPNVLLPAVAPFRWLAATPPEENTRARILPGCPSLDRRGREAKVGFEPRT